MNAVPESRALVLLGHADPQSFNAELAAAYVDGWRTSGREVELIALAELQFDLVLRTGHQKEQPLEPDLLRVKTAIERSKHVVWVFPTYWVSPPALVRGLVDRLFLPDWAFRYEGRSLPTGLLAGRSSRVIVTMDSPGWWYTLAHRRSIHASMGTGTLDFVGFSPVHFTPIGRVRELDVAARRGWIARIRELAAREAHKLGTARRELGVGLRSDRAV